jgi:predicted  nucleic acid-binding Zn-ribbon protein
LQANVNSTNYQINARQNELDDIKEVTREKEALLIATETSTQDRILILADLKDLSERTGQLEAEIDMLIDDRARSETELANYQSSVADFGY